MIYERNIDGLIAWLKDEDQTKTYNWLPSDDCLFTRFKKAVGGTDEQPYIEVIPQFDVRNSNIEQEVALPKPHTYGAALKRATKWKEEHDV